MRNKRGLAVLLAAVLMFGNVGLGHVGVRAAEDGGTGEPGIAAAQQIIFGGGAVA